MKLRCTLPSMIRITTLVAIVCSTMVSQVYAEISEARNFYKFSDNILSSGQPKQSHLESASEDGLEVVINIVPSSEAIYNPREKEILEKQGIEYFHTPVNWKSPKESEIRSFLNAMDEVGDRKVLVHCWANARASALIHVYQMTQSSDNAEARYTNLNKVWEEVAGYSLERNETWKNVIEQYAVE
ncbi:MAG: protein tyrosine phosphatase family protein [Granulosicoccus sp.]